MPPTTLPPLPASTGNGAVDAYTQAGLGALTNGGPDYTQTNAYKSLAALLGPGANGGLSDSLMSQYNTGSALIGARGTENVSKSISGSQARGLGGSSIAAQGVENENFNTTMADSALLSSLYGQQTENTRALAGDLASGSNAELSDLLGIYESAGTSAANMQMYSQGLQEALAAAGAASKAQQNAGLFGGAGAALGPALGVGAKYALM